MKACSLLMYVGGPRCEQKAEYAARLPMFGTLLATGIYLCPVHKDEWAKKMASLTPDPPYHEKLLLDVMLKPGEWVEQQ